uniref:Uncharacterized protein n=1 Tax=viral metagenome TaxID=1070528 RepID=A0A6C0BVY8_9ZZZZ
MSNQIKIVFYNFFNIGDTYFAQPFVKNIIDNNGNNFQYYIMAKFNYFIYQSILPDINIIDNDNINLSSGNLQSYDYYFFKEQNILFINTWIGNYIYIHCHRKEYFLTYYKETMVECDPVSYIKSYQTMLNLILNKENIKINYNNDPLLAVPTFPPNLDINKFLNFKKNNTGKKIVFFNNYYPGSGQILSIHNVDDRIRIIDFFIKKNYIVLLPEYEHYLQVYKEKNNVIDLYFAPVIFDMVINKSCYNVYFNAKVAHNCDVVLYFDTGKNFTYLNQEFIDEYKNNINRNTKIHFGISNYYFNSLSNPVYFPEGYVNFIQAENCDTIIEKLEKSNYL